MLNKQVFQRVQSAYSKGIQSASSRLSNRHIYAVLASNRATFLANEHKKGQRISEWAYQLLPCVEFEEIQLSHCNNAYKSKYRLPSPVMGRDKYLLSITGIDGNLSFNENKWESAKYKSANKYTSDTPDFFIRDGYLYIINMIALTSLPVYGIFNDPVEAERFINCNGISSADDCKSNLDMEFPFEDDLLTGLIDKSVTELIVLFNQNREDITNNKVDNILNETK